MNIEMIIILIIIFFAGISIFLGIFNWIKLISVSLKISKLEEEVEKKTIEFDASKKERQAQLQKEDSLLYEKQSLLNNLPPSSFIPEASNSPIKVVRSYRAGFQNSGSTTENDHSPLYASGNAFMQNQAQPVRQNEENTIEILLYSDSKKETDFLSAWKRLVGYLSVTNSPQVVLNFDKIMFFSDKELDYLEKMLDIVTKAHGSLKVSCCHQEILRIFRSRPALAQFVNKSSMDRS